MRKWIVHHWNLWMNSNFFNIRSCGQLTTFLGECTKEKERARGVSILRRFHTVYNTLSQIYPHWNPKFVIQLGIPSWIRIQIGIPSWIVDPLRECRLMIREKRLAKCALTGHIDIQKNVPCLCDWTRSNHCFMGDTWWWLVVILLDNMTMQKSQFPVTGMLLQECKGHTTCRFQMPIYIHVSSCSHLWCQILTFGLRCHSTSGKASTKPGRSLVEPQWLHKIRGQ